MTSIILTRCEEISTPLALLQEESYPMLLSKQELKTLNSCHVLSVLQGTHLSPSQMAGLDTHDLDEVILQADQIFRKNVDAYKREFERAYSQDLVTIQELLESSRFFVLQSVGGGVISGAMGGGFTGSTLLPILGTFLGSLLGAAAGGISGFIAGREIRKKSVLKEGSAYRLRCLQIIDQSERQRLTQLQEVFTLRAECLYQTLLKSESQGMLSNRTAKHLSQVLKVQSAFMQLSQNERHNLKAIEQYLNGLQEKFALEIT